MRLNKEVLVMLMDTTCSIGVIVCVTNNYLPNVDELTENIYRIGLGLV